MSVSYTEYPDEAVFEIEVAGRVTQADMDAILPKLEAFIAQHGKVSMIEVLRSFKGFDLSTIWDGIKFDVAHLRDIDRVSVVTDIGWIGGMTKALAAVMPLQIRVFGLEDLADARAWTRSAQG